MSSPAANSVTTTTRVATGSGTTLAGLTLGLVGFGQIGRRVAERAIAFRMHVLVADPFIDPAAVRAARAEPVDLAALLCSADIVSIHARATAENRGLIGASELGRMRRGAYLINTARDSLVDEPAVVAALASGALAGAAFDVVSPSPPTGRHPLLAFPNVVITTHIGGATHETLGHGGEMAAAEIRRLAAGEPLVNVFNRTELAAASRGSASVTRHTLAIDLGTGSCRAVVFDEDGGQAGIGQREWSHATLPGHSRLAGVRHRAQLAAHRRLRPRSPGRGRPDRR